MGDVIRPTPRSTTPSVIQQSRYREDDCRCKIKSNTVTISPLTMRTRCTATFPRTTRGAYSTVSYSSMIAYGSLRSIAAKRSIGPVLARFAGLAKRNAIPIPSSLSPAEPRAAIWISTTSRGVNSGLGAWDRNVERGSALVAQPKRVKTTTPITPARIVTRRNLINDVIIRR